MNSETWNEHGEETCVHLTKSAAITQTPNNKNASPCWHRWSKPEKKAAWKPLFAVMHRAGYFPVAVPELPPLPALPVLEVPPELPAPASAPPAALGEAPEDLARLDFFFLDFLAFFGAASVVPLVSAEVPDDAAGEDELLPLVVLGEELELDPIAPLPLDELPLGDADDPELESLLEGDEPDVLEPLMPDEPEEPDEPLMPDEPDEPDEPLALEPDEPDEPEEPLLPEAPGVIPPGEEPPLLGVDAEVPVPPAMPASLPVPAPVAPVAFCDLMVDDGELALPLPVCASAMEDTDATTINDSERSVVFNVISNSFN